MKEFVKLSIACLWMVLLVPHFLCLAFSGNKRLLFEDLSVWKKAYAVGHVDLIALAYLMKWYPEFRNVFYYRIRAARLFSVFVRPLSTLYINCPEIKGGLFIQHGFSTIISAKSIGKNCTVCQQVTVGYKADGSSPTIGNNVKICAGAIVFGGIKVEDNSIIGAGAIVADDVPEYAVVCSPKAKIVKYRSLEA